MTLSTQDRGYVAAIIDGEGAFHIQKWSLTVSLALNNTNREVIEWLRSRLGGTISYKVPRGNRKPQFQWRLSGHKILSVLKQIRPAMIIKAKAADILLEFLQGYEYRALKGRAYSLPKSERSRRARLRKQLIQVNRRGKRG